MSTYLVTGGAGFIGSNIVEELLKRGEKVRVLDNFITGSRSNLDFAEGNKQSTMNPELSPTSNKQSTMNNELSANSNEQSVLSNQQSTMNPELSANGNEQSTMNYQLIEGDIRSKEDLQKALKGIDYVLHQAALRSVPKSVDDPFLTNDINVNGTLNLLFEAKKAGIKRLVYASSSACYGDVQNFPQKEDFNPRPISPYGVSKLAAENYCHTFSKTFGLETVSLRYFNVFGPRQNPESKYSAAIPALLSRMLNNKPPIVEWDGEQSRDFTYVGNVAEANLACAIAEGISGGEVFNVACGNSVSILDIVNALNKLLGTSLKPEFAPKRAGDVRKTYADVSNIRKITGPGIDFYEGLKRTVEWFKKNQDRLLKI